MARILFCWELGGALGHLAIIQALVERLHAQGHELHLAATHSMMANAPRMPVAFHAVPPWRHSAGADRPVRSYGHILRNVGYSDPARLAVQLRAWKAVLRSVRPDVLVCETSPTALLAARGMSIATALIGTGFSIPPRSYPLPDLKPWEPAVDSLRNDEDELMHSINVALAAEGDAPLSRLHDLYEAACTAVCSVPELDAYVARPIDSYVGELACLPGTHVRWPSAKTKRVFAYIKSFPEVPRFLEVLRDRDVSAIVYGPGVPLAVVNLFRSDRLCFVGQPVDVSHVLRAASLVVTHGHGLTLQTLRAGIPVLNFPLVLEQEVVARQVAALGAGAFCSPWGGDPIASTVDALLDDSSFANSAQKFAARYAHLNPETQALRLAARIGELAKRC